MSESFSSIPIQDIIPSYVYDQFSDDSDVQAFADSFNALAQDYLDWFNQTPLSLYTSPYIYGPLLDWTGNGIYGIARPVISTLLNEYTGSFNTRTFNTSSFNTFYSSQTGTTQIANDDIYKRVMTWILYKGDGMQVSIPWLKKRIARFISGSNGSDVSVDNLNIVSIEPVNVHAKGAFNTFAFNTMAFNSYQKPQNHAFEISVPATAISQIFYALFVQGVLPVPFQLDRKSVV